MGVTTFNEMEIDAIGEIMNISLGASATAVSTMLGTAVDITTPVVSVVDGKDFEFRKIEPAIGTEISYVEGLSGRNVMMFSRNDVRIIVGILMGMEIPMEEFELDEINRSAVCEVMNQMMGSSATALSEFLGYPVNISTPISFEISDNDMFKEKYFREDQRKIVVRFNLEIKDKIKSEFLNIMSTDLAKKLLEPFGIPSGDLSQPEPQPAAEEPAPQPTPAETPASSGGMLSQAEIEALMAGGIAEEPAPQPAPAETPASSGGMLSQAEIEALMAGGITEEPAPQPAPVPQPVPAQPVVETPVMAQPMAAPVQMVAPAMDPMMLQLLNQMQQSQMQMMEMMNSMRKEEKPKPEPTSSSIIRPVSPAQLDDGVTNGEEENVNQEMLLKVPLEVSVEIGRTKKLVKDILEYTQGSLVVLDKMAGEQADLYVNGRCIARGDIVVVEDNFGIRITEIVTRNLNPETL